MRKTYTIRIDDTLRARLVSVSTKTGYSVSKLFYFFINTDWTLEKLEVILKPYNEKDGVDETFLIKNGIIILGNT